MFPERLQALTQLNYWDGIELFHLGSKYESDYCAGFCTQICALKIKQ